MALEVGELSASLWLDDSLFESALAACEASFQAFGGRMEAQARALAAGAGAALATVFSRQAGASLGSALVNGVIAGVAARSGALEAAMGAMASRALAAAKARLGIRSPSAVMRDQVGAMIARGVGQGILDHLDEVTGPMGLLSRTLTEELRLQSPREPEGRGRSRGEAVVPAPAFADAGQIGAAIADRLLEKGALRGDVLIDGEAAGLLLSDPLSRRLRAEAEGGLRGRAAGRVLS